MRPDPYKIKKSQKYRKNSAKNPSRKNVDSPDLVSKNLAKNNRKSEAKVLKPEDVPESEKDAISEDKETSDREIEDVLRSIEESQSLIRFLKNKIQDEKSQKPLFLNPDKNASPRINSFSSKYDETYEKLMEFSPEQLDDLFLETSFNDLIQSPFDDKYISSLLNSETLVPNPNIFELSSKGEPVHEENSMKDLVPSLAKSTHSHIKENVSPPLIENLDIKDDKKPKPAEIPGFADQETIEELEDWLDSSLASALLLCLNIFVTLYSESPHFILELSEKSGSNISHDSQMLKKLSPLFAALLIYRLLNVCLVRNFMHPDETWQSLEVAHRLVFGYGYLTWEWKNKLREWAFPFLFATLYKFSSLLGLDNFLLLKLPYFFVCIMSAITDYSTFLFAKRFCNINTAKPLGNSIETAFSSLAFAYWPWSKLTFKKSSNFQKDLQMSLIFASVACVLRPTNCVVWLVAGISLFLASDKKLLIIKNTIFVGCFAFLAMVTINRIGYGELCFPAVNFYVFNVSQNLAVSKHSQSRTSISRAKAYADIEPAVVAFVSLIIYSFAGHKEYRFLYPILPIGFLYAGIALDHLYNGFPVFNKLFQKDSAKIHRGNSLRGHNLNTANYECRETEIYTKTNNSLNQLLPSIFPSKKLFLVIILATNFLPALFVNLFHNVGVVSVMKYLRSETKKGNVEDILFLMPCHSTPYYSHLHSKIPMYFLTCDPPLDKEQLDTHYWEAKDFDDDPIKFLDSRFVPKSALGVYVSSTSVVDGNTNVQFLKPIVNPSLNLEHSNSTKASSELEMIKVKLNAIKSQKNLRFLSSHIVFYSSMESRLSPYLQSLGYSECARFFNTFFEPDERRRGSVVVFRLNHDKKPD
ncbi:hypothetical protein BB560_002000, partial [Smittium megazygosporum]